MLTNYNRHVYWTQYEIYTPESKDGIQLNRWQVVRFFDRICCGGRGNLTALLGYAAIFSVRQPLCPIVKRGDIDGVA